jgi:hypothetical protein
MLAPVLGSRERLWHRVSDTMPQVGDNDLERGIESFRRQVELFSRGEYDAALELHAPDVEIVTRDPDVAITGVWRGPEGHDYA